MGEASTPSKNAPTYRDGKKRGPRLREVAPLIRGSREAGSRNLWPAFLTIAVRTEAARSTWANIRKEAAALGGIECVG